MSVELCTLDQVREGLQRQSMENEQDRTLQDLIDRASEAIQQPNVCGQILAPEDDDGTRTFVWEGGRRLNLFPYYARTVTEVRVDTDTTASTVDDYRLRPPSPLDGVYRWLRFPSGTSSCEAEVEIDGTWGFATVPGPVVQATVVTVLEWLRKDIAAMSTQYVVSEDRVDRPEPIPRGAMRLLGPWLHQGQG